MAARTLEDTFGVLGQLDNGEAFTDRIFHYGWNFAATNCDENKTFPLGTIPAGFVIDRITVVQRKAADQSIGLTFGLASDNSKTIGGTFTLSNSEDSLLFSSQSASASSVSTTTGKDTVGGTQGTVDFVKTVTLTDSGGGMFVGADDVVCMIIPDGLTGDKATLGAFDVFLHGFDAGVWGGVGNPIPSVTFRQKLQTVDNVSGGQFPLDPLG